MGKAEEQIAKIQKGLGCSYEEAKAVYEDDCRIDKGEKLFELTKEQEKASKKARGIGTKVKQPTAYKFTQRTRKENTTKAEIIAELAKFLTENSENACEMVEITNKERQIAFKIGENAFELTLVQKRKPKN